MDQTEAPPETPADVPPPDAIDPAPATKRRGRRKKERIPIALPKQVVGVIATAPLVATQVVARRFERQLTYEPAAIDAVVDAMDTFLRESGIEFTPAVALVVSYAAVIGPALMGMQRVPGGKTDAQTRGPAVANHHQHGDSGGAASASHG